ncbi:MAG: hypothetical protein ABI889_05910 [Gemmatimonadota bacterium]
MQHTPLTRARTALAANLSALATLSITMLVIAGCAKHDSSQPAQDSAATAGATASAAGSASSASAASGAPSDITPIRGTVATVSDSMLTVSTTSGDVRVVVEEPLHVYSRVPSKLASVTPGSFVGVTSVAQPDGSQRATEIHIFPEELRGTGEGSYLMTPPPGSDSSHRSKMTNGTVSADSKTGGPPRMTNGAVASQGAGALTVKFRGGSQTITIPLNVSVTALAPATVKLAPGARVVVLGRKQPDGTMKASSLVLADSAAGLK